MDITFSTGSLTGYPLRTAIGAARRVGADGVELMLTPGILRRGPESIMRMERELSVPVRSAHTILRLRPVHPGQLANDIIESAQFAARLPDCAALVVHTPESHALHTQESQSWLRAIEYACEIAQDSQLSVTIENSGRLSDASPTSYLDHPERLRMLAAEWNLGITFDTAHAASRGWDILPVAEQLLPLLKNVHLSDLGSRTHRSSLANAFLRDHRLPGTGTLPLNTLISILAAKRYSGTLTLELSPLALRAFWFPGAIERLAQAIEFCREGARLSYPVTERSHPPRRS